jgi:protein TonB
MTRPFSVASLTIALLLHAGLIALAVTELPAKIDSPPKPISMAVQLLPVQEKEAPMPAPVPPPPPAPSPPPPPALSLPEKKPVEPKPVPKPKPKPKAAAKPRPAPKSATPEIKTPATALPPTASSTEPVQPVRPPVAAAAPEAPPAPAAPAPPAKTGVYISAEYAATNRKPAYPPMSMRYGEQGTVTLRVFVKADGTAGQVEIRSSSGYPLLDESARTAVQSWRFRPATSDGKPVGDWFLIPIPFKLQQ